MMHGPDAGAEHFGQRGPAVQPEAQHRRLQRLQPDADLHQAEIEDEQLGQHRHRPEHVHINLHYGPDDA